MNKTLNNSANEYSCDLIGFVSRDSYELIRFVLRIVILILNVIWLIFALRYKEIRCKEMVFTINFAGVGIYHCVTSIINIYVHSCGYQVNTIICSFFALNTTFIACNSGYAIMALFLNRMACVYYTNFKVWYKWKLVLIVLAFVWLFPFSSVTITVLAFDSRIYFNEHFGACLFYSINQAFSITLYAFISIVLPNLLILISYLMVNHKLRKLKKSLGNARGRIEPLRITVQLVISILLFEAYLTSNLILSIEISKPLEDLSIDVLKILLIVRWLHHICPLGLLYFHPILLEKYKRVLSFLLFTRN